MEDARITQAHEPSPSLRAEDQAWRLRPPVMKGAPRLGDLFPGHFFLEVRTGDKWADAWTHDLDLECMEARFDYGAEQLKPGQGIRLRNWRGEVLKEK